MYELTVSGHFDAAHYLKDYIGKCAHIHGHRWQVEAKIRGHALDQKGMLVDFSLIKKKLREITDNLDHCLLNDLVRYKETNPTAENIARFIYQDLEASLKEYEVTVHQVTVWESPVAAAAYFEEQ